jgi:hypothetical protein
MLLTSMGVFGFLSKAHSDQDLVSGDVIAKISIYDEKIRQARDNIDMARKALVQMDAAVDQTLGRSSTEQGADKAAQLRRSQANERNRLLKEIDTEQKKIQKISEERAPIAAEVRKVEAEVGPIKYIAALIYGDNPEANVLEKSVRWVIILIVIVFDPLALTLLLAATKSIEWERGINILATQRKRPEYEPDDGPLTDDQLDQLRAMAKTELPTGKVVAEESLFSEADEFFDRARTVAQDIDAGTYEPLADEAQPIVSKSNKLRVLTGINSMWNKTKNSLIKDPESEHAPIEITTSVADVEDSDKFSETETDERRLELICERAWKEQNPDKTLKRERQLFRAGITRELPWNNAEFRSKVLAHASTVRGFGNEFPATAIKGDMFLRTDRLPSALYKFNGINWIEVDKSSSDHYAYDEAYIDYLIEKIGTGEYDTDLLSDIERDCIEKKLKNE